MEAERQRFETRIQADAKGNVREVSDRAVGKPESFTFGAPNDTMTYIIKSGYISRWNPDFLQKELGREGECSRFYYDQKMAVDVGDPESKTVRRKRKLLFQNGVGYMCVPERFSESHDALMDLYEKAIREYYAYEELHPRPKVFQEALILDSDGNTRRAKLTAVDVKVGRGIVGSQEVQQRELLRASQPLTRKELKLRKRRVKLHRALRRCAQTGQPFRNPFIGKGKRLYNVHYSS